MKLKAGALQYVIFISIVIAIVLSSFILYLSIQKQVKYKSRKFQELIFDTNNAFDYIKQKNIVIKDSLSLGLSSIEDIGTTKLNQTPWGIFNKVSVITTFKNQQFQKVALLGGYKKQKPALYLQENNKPLVLVGDTEITGKVYLPSQGVKRGTIAGHSYSGSQLIYGNRSSSRRHLPTLENRTYLQNLCKGIVTTQLEPFQLETTNFDKTKNFNSFQEVTKYYKNNGIINLRDIDISGNFIIHSETLIKVFNTSKLKNVILIAPYIDIQEKTKGNFQAFATKGIIVEKDCQLDYPSVLVVAETNKNNTTNSQNQSTENHQISIASNTQIKGSICFLTDDLKTNHKVQIDIQNDALITGEIYCEKNTALSGMVNGTIYTKAFITNAFGSIYHNHIYNGFINSNNVPQQFTGLVFKNEQKEIVQWVY